MSNNHLPSSRRFLAARQLIWKAYGPYRWSILSLTALGFLSGILEGIGVNALIPLLTFVVDVKNPATDTISGVIRSLFSFLNVDFAPKFLLAFIVILFIGKAFVAFLLSYIQARITATYEAKTRSKLFATVLHSSWPHLLKQRLGHLETVLMIDVSASTSLFARLSAAIVFLTSLLIYLIVAFNISRSITLVTISIGATVFLLFKQLLYRMRMFATIRARTNRDMTHHVSEYVGGMKSVKAMGIEESGIARADELFGTVRDLNVRVSSLRNIPVALIPAIGILYIALIFGLVFRTHFISLAAFPAIVYLIYRIFVYIQQTQDTIQGVNELVPHLQSVLSYEEAARIEREETPLGSLPFSFSRELSFEKVAFSYENGKEVLRDLEFSLTKGDMVGIIGPSGAGKTTCVDLMLRLLEPTSGRILLDGIDSKTISRSAWREKIGYVSQEFFLVNDTIRNNIRFYSPDITDEALWEAARMARIDTFIKNSAKGLETLIGDRGITISAGERQRLVIARALARKPEILILDEATSALDTESEAHIKHVIEELKGNVTIIAVAHRLSTIMDSDMLLVLQDGKVTEQGVPQELMKDKDSYFFKVNSILE